MARFPEATLQFLCFVAMENEHSDQAGSSNFTAENFQYVGGLARGHVGKYSDTTFASLWALGKVSLQALLVLSF